MSNPLPPNPGQPVPVTPFDETALRAAQGAVEAARHTTFGITDPNSFEAKQAEAALFAATQQAEGLSYAHRQHGEQVAFNERLGRVDANHNGLSDQAEIRAAEDARVMDLGKAAVGMAMTAGMVGMIATGPGEAFNSGALEPMGAPQSFSPGPAAFFNARGWNAKTAFGIEPSLGDIPNPATYAAAPIAAEANEDVTLAEPSGLAAAPAHRPVPQSMRLEMGMAPKPNAAFFERHGGK